MIRLRSPGDIGSFVRDSRATRGLTQAALARAVGVSRKWIIDLERGKSTAELGLVLRTFRALGITIGVEPAEAKAPASGVLDLNALVDATRHRTPR